LTRIHRAGSLPPSSRHPAPHVLGEPETHAASQRHRGRQREGRAGKSTIAIHIAVALLHGGAKVAVLDLDLRQQSMGHFFANRRAWLAANGADAPMPIEHPLSSDGAALAKAPDEEALARFEEAFQAVAEQADFGLIDTPGQRHRHQPRAHARPTSSSRR
jgi:cellulose biosynthesis protein BcsQ